MENIAPTSFKSEIRSVERLMAIGRNVLVGMGTVELAIATENILQDAMLESARNAFVLAAGMELARHGCKFIRQKVESGVNSDLE